MADLESLAIGANERVLLQALRGINWAAVKGVWDEKEQVERIAAADVPRLNEANNKSVLDFKSALVFNVRDLPFLHIETLRKIAHNLQISDGYPLNHNVLVIYIKHKDDAPSTRKSDSKLNDVILLNTGEVLRASLYQGGQLTCVEYRDIEGNLTMRGYFRNDIEDDVERWKDGILSERIYYDDKGRRMGPYFVRDWTTGEGTVEYHLNGDKVSKREWMGYLQRVEQAIRNLPAMISGVDALITAYTNF